MILFTEDTNSMNVERDILQLLKALPSYADRPPKRGGLNLYQISINVEQVDPPL